MSMNRNNLFLAIGLCGLWLACSCASLYTGTVTLTAIVDDAAKEYARAFNSGLVPKELDDRVSASYLQYRQAAGIAHDALVAYKLSGDPAQFNISLQAAKEAAGAFVETIGPIIAKDEVAKLKLRIQSASKP